MEQLTKMEDLHTPNIENKEDVVEQDIPKEKIPIHKMVFNQVTHFVDTNGYSSLAIGAGVFVGLFLFVKYKLKK